ncbi:DEAD/DEAH box helicase [Polaribacter aestuariivivens]|uniref:DEAD/DEAH box helicase n=1 Tax=Polaribacter aestuariivivens TaxID=2304626 RepID=A0A5S3N798_9FLAO|nr:DEAD/DEAH box helicase [Polaribacter aestuariivivens]TMM31215.1 DEAD/DEAH box helicase [Polaribacter aestuariivivens]
MPFKKLHPHLKEKIAQFGIDTPTRFQKASIGTIKSGANVYCIAPNNSGKTTTLIWTTLQKLQCEAQGTAPRALVFVENNEQALALYDAFLLYTRHTDLRVYVANEREHIDLLKSEIFEGVDILIATVKTTNKLLLLEGLNTTQLKIIGIDDASFLQETNAYTALLATTQSIYKCQYVLYTNTMNASLQRLENYFMTFAKKILIK